MEFFTRFTWVLVMMVVAVATVVQGTRTAASVDLTTLGECSATFSRRHLYIVTMDGNVTALDQDGYMLWQYSLPHALFSSTLSYQKSSHDHGSPNLIPGLDGEVYQWDGTGMKRVKVSGGDLMDTNILRREGTTLVGSREWDVVALNTREGEQLYECSKMKCQQYERSATVPRTSALKISTHRVMVKEIEDFTGDELWNFTISEVTLSLMSEGVAGKQEGPHSPIDWHLHVDAQSGALVAVRSLGNGSSSTLWTYKLSAPVVGVWLHEDSCLHKLHLHVSLPSKDPLLLVSHLNMLYLQSVIPEHHFPLHPPIIPFTITQVPFLTKETADPLSFRKHELSLYQEDYHGSVAESKELCTEYSNALAPFYHGLVQGVCRDDMTQNWSQRQEQIGHTQGSLFTSFMNSPTYTLLFYFLFVIVMVMMDRLHEFGKRSTGRVLSISIEDDECRLQSPEQCPCDTPATPLVFPQSPCGLHPIPEHTEPPPVKEVVSESRFGLDYELKGQLGKGGFGVVYHVRSRTDGGEYAVKRIRLPNQELAREKVMREVLVLARLDHPRIVRYYHSWVERAPMGWSGMQEWATLSQRDSCVTSEQPSVISSAEKNTLSPSPSPSLSPNHGVIHSKMSSATRDQLDGDEDDEEEDDEEDSSSFVIEFKDDTYKSGPPGTETEEGCFSKDMLIARDELSDTDDSLHNSRQKELIHTTAALDPPTCLFIQMQLCRKDTLRDWLNTNVANRCHKEAMHYFEQVLDAVQYIHGNRLIHRDLKPSNIFFSLDGSVKVGDFGLVACNTAEVLHSSYVALKSLQEDHRLTGNIGSHFYMSPEQMNATRYNEKVDIFALGVIFFELHHPFRTEMERVKVLEDLKKYMFPPSFKNAGPPLIQFIEWLMARNPTKRPTAKEVAGSRLFVELRSLATPTSMTLEP